MKKFRTGSEKRIQKTARLDLIYGEAAFAGARSLEVRLRKGGVKTLHAERIFINAGCRPAIPALDGLKDVPFLDSTSIMELARVPQHLLVLGGGYVGLEFGQLFRRLGSRVTIVQNGTQLLAREDEDVAKEVATILKEDGVEVLLNTKAESAARSRSDIALKVRSKRGARTIVGTHLLVATGRVPNTEALHLAAAGIATDKRGFIPVDNKLQTNVSGVFALGDINGGPAFTHISYDDFRIIRTNVIGKGSATTTDRLVPYTVFMDPQLGRVGLTEAQARGEGRKIRVAKMPMTYVARAWKPTRHAAL